MRRRLKGASEALQEKAKENDVLNQHIFSLKDKLAHLLLIQSKQNAMLQSLSGKKEQLAIQLSQLTWRQSKLSEERRARQDLYSRLEENKYASINADQKRPDSAGFAAGRRGVCV